MSRRKAKTPGWAAFDPKIQQKQVTNDETHDSFPPISTNISTRHHRQNPSRNIDLNGRSFSSVLTHSASVPNIMGSEDTHSPLNVPNLVAVRGVPNVVNAHALMENSQSEKIENNVSQVYKKLKELHPWANDNLIEDIVAAVDNDIDKASSILRDMAPPGRLQEKKEAGFENNIEEISHDNSVPENTSLHVEKATRPTIVSESPQVSQNTINIKNGVLLDGRAFHEKVINGDNVSLGLLLDSLSMIPKEPEWEDDDMYIMHRKEAIRSMRLASRYSKAATEAYLRRDHAAAQEFSIKAREEWSASEKLNAKAAKEILAIRNCENDDWKLDLHGLHASEAVQVLQDHLLKLESQGQFTKPYKTILKGSSKTEKLDRQQQLSRPRLLEVITGKGSHSRGEAALPIAIKSFLSEKGYYYYEARIGVITVQPKFRQLSTALSNT